MRLNRRLLLLFPLLLALSLGCKSKNPNAPARVSGQITYKGKPVGGGMITFYKDGGGSYALPIDKDGTYQGTDLPVGDLGVTVETESVKKLASPSQYGGGQGRRMTMSPAPNYAKNQEPAAAEYVKIPAKYANPKTSGLSVTLSAGRQVHNFELAD